MTKYSNVKNKIRIDFTQTLGDLAREGRVAIFTKEVFFYYFFITAHLYPYFMEQSFAESKKKTIFANRN